MAGVDRRQRQEGKKKRQIDTQVPIRADSVRIFHPPPSPAAPLDPQTKVGAHKTDERNAPSAGSSEPFKG